jgi:hypothetical protein
MGFIIVAILIAAFIVGVVLFLCWASNVDVNKLRGKVGENMVKAVIDKAVKGKQYLFNDYMVDSFGKTSQIDHIVVSKNGVFVIETKNYSGRIYGTEEQREWTQVLADGSVKNKIYNPLKQNETHVNVIKRIIGDAPIIPVVVFVKSNIKYIQSDKVYTLRTLRIALLQENVVLSNEQIDKIGKKLTENNVRGVVSDETHVQNIKIEQEKIKNNICPRCNGHLVLRKGKYGEFWGCSNYPKCRFIKK